MNRIRSITCMAMICMLAAVKGWSQSTAPYIIFKTTYAFAGNPQRINEATAMVQGREYTRGVYGSYGRGVALQLGVGKMINPTFGFEVSAEFMPGKKLSTTFTDDVDSVYGGQSDKVRGLLIKPVIVIRNSGDLLSIYTKLGLAISTATSRYEESDIRFVLDGQGDQVIYKAKETAKAKVGFTACFGLSFRVTESFSLFTEVNGQMLSLPITKGHYTSYLHNGADQLSKMTVREKSWVYERGGYFDDQQPNNRPEKRLYTPANYSYIGIGVGFIYHF